MLSTFHKVEFFKDVLDLFQAYYRLHDSLDTNGFVRDLAMEVNERICHLDYILTEVKVSEYRIAELTERSSCVFKKFVEEFKRQENGTGYNPPPETMPAHEEVTEISKLWLEAEIKTEYFYYSAFRVRTIIKKFPGLKNFESAGVRDVRNKLIEHPDKDHDSQVFIRSFGLGNREKGPVIKSIRYSKQIDVFPDAGLYVNASEFRNELEKILSNQNNM